MTESVETKGAGTDVASDAADLAKAAPKVAARPRIKAAEPKVRQDEPAKPDLDPIVSSAPIAAAIPSQPGTSDVPNKPVAPIKASWLDGRAIAASIFGLVLGTGFGMVAAPREHGGGFAQVTAALEAGRTESARLNAEVERISNSLATIRESSEAARGDGRTFGTGMTERLDRLEQALSQSLAAVGDKVEQAERAQSARIAGLAVQVEKRAALLPTPSAVTPPVAKAEPQPVQKVDVTAPAKPEPEQTGALGDVKPKPATIDGWALREVFDGMAILESRRRRLIEVAPGTQIPGVGRVEAIEKRGRNWVVVTKQGLITPQNW